MPLAVRQGQPTKADLQPGRLFYGVAPDGVVATLWDYTGRTVTRDGVTRYLFADGYGDCDAAEPFEMAFKWPEVQRLLTVCP